MPLTRIHAQSIAHLVDEFDFSGFSNNCNLAIASAPVDLTSFADTDMTFGMGKGSFAINVGGLFDGSAGYDSEMFIDLTATGRRVGIYPPGIGSSVTALTTGNFGYEGSCNSESQSRTGAIGAAIVLDVGWKGTDPLTRSVILDVNTAVAATGTGTAIQRGAAASTDTIEATLRLIAAPGGSGNNTLNVTIDSDDVSNFGGTPATQLTFTQLNQASTAQFEVKTAAGAITDTWWRVDYTYAGAGSRTFSLIITFGIKPT
jgi:hypothetical protein